MISDEELEKYVNESFTEEIIRRCEDQLLAILAHRQGAHPSEKHAQEWFAFKDYVCERRYKKRNE